jgi:alpha-amylase
MVWMGTPIMGIHLFSLGRQRMKKYLSMAGALVLLVAIGLAVFLFFRPELSSPHAPPMFLPSPSPTVIPSTPPVTQVPALSQGTDGYPWWNDTIFYEIFVRSFCDSNGDGIGDFNGITEKLDYLKNLGVTGLWLMPINPSPSYHGYDVTNYFAVNPDYGTIADFKTLVSEAHNRGIRVIIDMVLNHTSSQHPWFIAAQDPNSPYRNFYIWSDTKPVYSGPWGEQVWYPTITGYYYAIFSQSMPDLNYRNTEVTAQMENAVKFWLETTGIDGFRLDAARHLIENGTVQANTPETHAWFKQFHGCHCR